MALTTGQRVGIVLGVIFGIGATAYFVIRAEAAPPAEYCCLYCPDCFATYEELVDHVKTEHPGERIPLPIEWD